MQAAMQIPYNIGPQVTDCTSNSVNKSIDRRIIILKNRNNKEQFLILNNEQGARKKPA